MNLQEFIDLHTTGVLNFAGHINVMYEEQGDGTGLITALTITQAALSVNGSTLAEDTNINTILQQVEEISFVFDNVNYVLTVVDFSYYGIPASSGFPFYLFIVESTTPIPDIDDIDLTFGSITGNNTLLNFTPVLNAGLFNISDYNILLNNGNKIRKSSIILQADRKIGSLQAASAVPSNFDALLTTSASKAEVQDSFYTDTGLTNARYNGSKATPKTFSNISPSLSANEFIGDIHPNDTNVTIVCTYNNNDRVNEPLLHTGPNRLPGFTTGSLGINLQQDVTNTQTVLPYVIGGAGTFKENIDPGDILILNTGGGTEAVGEKVKVITHNMFTSTLEVERGVLSTTPLSPLTPGGTSIWKVQRTDLYRIDDFIRNLSAVENSIIYEKETHSLLYTDPFGLVFSQSFCPEPVDTSVDDAG